MFFWSICCSKGLFGVLKWPLYYSIFCPLSRSGRIFKDITCILSIMACCQAQFYDIYRTPPKVHIASFHERASIHFETYIVYTILFALSYEYIFKRKKSEPGITQASTSQKSRPNTSKWLQKSHCRDWWIQNIYLVFILKVRKTTERQCLCEKNLLSIAISTTLTIKNQLVSKRKPHKNPDRRCLCMFLIIGSNFDKNTIFVIRKTSSIDQHAEEQNSKQNFFIDSWGVPQATANWKAQWEVLA